jgi:predicted transposase YbfD/YdcC
MLCTAKKTFELAENAGATLITQVKNNQASLLKQIKYGTLAQVSIDVYEEAIDKVHGRIEKRKYEVFNSLPMLKNWREEWPYVRNVIRVTRQRDDNITISYYVSNGELAAKEFGKHIRQHWHIENKLHHIKDATFYEDKHRKQVNPWIFSAFIDWSLNILKGSGITNIRQALYGNAMDLMSSIQYVV